MTELVRVLGSEKAHLLRRMAGFPFWAAVVLIVTPACSNNPSDITGPAADAEQEADAAADILKTPTMHASIVVTPPSGNAPLPVEISLTVDGVDKSELFVVWDFGDGDVSNPYDLGTEEGKGGDHVLHTYISKGNYPIAANVSWKPKAKTVHVTATTTLQVNDAANLSLDPGASIHVLSQLVVAPGDDVTVTFAIRNDGDAITQAFDTAIILSTDATIDDGDTLADNLTNPGMPSGQPNTSFIDYGALGLPGALPPAHFKVPAGLADGTYYVFVWTDKGKLVNEFNREDNLAYATDVLTVDTKQASKPDLTISAPDFDSVKTYSPGDSLNYTQNVSNIGLGEAKQVKYAVFLSQDQKLDFDPSKDPADPSQPDKMLTALANSTLLKLNPGATLPLTYSLQVPKGTPDGNYYLIAKIDVLDKIDESDEGNNIAATTNTVTVKLVIKQGEDLGLLDMTVQPKGTYLNGTVSVKYHVKNLGTKQTDIFPATIYFCQDKAFSEATCVLNKTTFTIPALAVGEELTAAKIVTISPTTPVANIKGYFIYLRIDPQNLIAELDETNNVKVFDNLIITATANVDIWPSDIGFHPAQVQAGSELKISYAIHNDGTTGSGASSTWYALSANGICSVATVTSGQAILLKKVISSGVEGLDVSQVADIVTIPAGLDHNVSDYTFCVILDGDKQLAKETKTDNNAAGSLSKLKVLNPQGGCYEDPYDLSPANNNAPVNAVPTPTDPTQLLGSCGNEDWYTIDVPKGWTLIATLDVTAPLWTTPVPADLDLDLYAPDATTVLDSQKILSMNKKASALTVLTAGKYYVRVYPHETNAKAQYNLGVTLVAPPAGIDVYAANLVVSPAATFPGGLIKVKLQAANLGGTAAGDVTVHFVLSQDQVVDPADTALIDVVVPNVGPASPFSAEKTIELPVVTGGKWFVLATLTLDPALTETTPGNNFAVSNPLQLNTQVSCASDGFSGNHTVDNSASLPPITASYTKLNVCPGLEDWFKLEIPDGKAFSAKVNWTYQPGKGLIGVQIVDASKTGVVAGSATTQNTIAKLPYVQTGGTYYVHVYVLPEAGGALPYDYQLDIGVTEPDPSDVCLADYYEPNNSWQSGQPLGCGTATQSLCLGDEDWFHMPLAANDQVILSYDNPAFQLRVYGNPNLPPLKTLGSPGALTFIAPSDGLYHIQMSYKAAGQKPASFAYTFKVDGGTGVDLISTINSVFPSQIVQGEDVYLTVTLSNECTDVAGGFSYAYYYSADATLDASDVLLGMHGVPDGLGSKANVQRDDKAIIPLSAMPGPGFVILSADASNTVAESQELNNNSSSSVTVIPLCIGDALEPNGAPEIAVLLPQGKTEYLSLCPYDLDWYKVKLTAGQVLTVTMAFDQAKGDLDMRLYKVAQFGQPVAVGATKSAPETFSYTADETTMYYLRIDGFNGTAAGYTLFTCIGDGMKCVECATTSQCGVGKVCNPATTLCSLCVNDGECLDGDPCTNDLCDATLGCLHLPTDATCTDGLICTVGDTCAQGVCLSGSGTDCDDANVCTDDKCDPTQGCVHAFNTAPCFDGNACSSGDTCGGGVCVSGGTALNCDDGNACTDDGCSGPTGCSHAKLDAIACDDGNGCLLGEACSSGICLAGTVTPDCNDGFACTTDACDPKSGCTNTNIIGVCDDGDPCTAVDTCNGIHCIGALKLFCDDGNPCTVDACAGLLGCTHTALTGAACNDGLFCTGLDTCTDGACGGVTGGKCDDGNVCTSDACGEAAGCSHGNLAGTACTDNNACTVGDACGGGTCVPAGLTACDDSNACTFDSCDPVNGCVHTPISCDDSNACTADSCSPATGCVTAPVNCNDSNACTIDSCDPATGCGYAPKICDDSNDCTTDSCDPGSGCSNVSLPNDTTCTAGACQNGTCTPP
jgi:hypothetical protein